MSTGFYASGAAFSSATDDWFTPRDVVRQWRTMFPIRLDAAASAKNRVVPLYYGLDHPDPNRRDGLAGDWARDAGPGGAVWLNPPYGRTIGAWMTKAVEEADKGATVVCLVPARTDTKWFQDTALTRFEASRADIVLVAGRLRFGGSKSAAPFPSSIVVFRPPHTHGALRPALLRSSRSLGVFATGAAG